MSKDKKLKVTGASLKLAFVFTDNPVQNILRKIKKSSKVRQKQKTLICF